MDEIDSDDEGTKWVQRCLDLWYEYMDRCALEHKKAKRKIKNIKWNRLSECEIDDLISQSDFQNVMRKEYEYAMIPETEVGFELVAIRAKDSGLPADIWLDDMGVDRVMKYNIPRVRVSDGDNTHCPLVPVSISAHPRRLLKSYDCGRLSENEWSKIFEWIARYKDELLRHWNKKIDAYDFCKLRESERILKELRTRLEKIIINPTDEIPACFHVVEMIRSIADELKMFSRSIFIKSAESVHTTIILKLPNGKWVWVEKYLDEIDEYMIFDLQKECARKILRIFKKRFGYHVEAYEYGQYSSGISWNELMKHCMRGQKIR